MKKINLKNFRILSIIIVFLVLFLAGNVDAQTQGCTTAVTTSGTFATHNCDAKYVCDTSTGTFVSKPYPTWPTCPGDAFQYFSASIDKPIYAPGDEVRVSGTVPSSAGYESNYLEASLESVSVENKAFDPVSSVPDLYEVSPLINSQEFPTSRTYNINGGTSILTFTAPTTSGTHYINFRARSYAPGYYSQATITSFPFTVASCTDGIQNQAETGIDCGGPCPTACVTIPTPTPTCSAIPNPVEVNQQTVISATGGTGTPSHYSWLLKAGGEAGAYTWTDSGSSGTGPVSTSHNFISVLYTAPGTKTVKEFMYTAQGVKLGEATCTINVRAAPCADDQIIMRLFSSSNSHIYQWSNTDASVKICYDEIFGSAYTGANSHACTPNANNPNNAVIRTFGNSASNTHAENPSSTTLGYFPVCYGDLNCRLVSSANNCGPDPKEELVAYLSGETNAHIAKFDAPSSAVIGWRKLCCKSSSAPIIACGDGEKKGTEECDYAAVPGSVNNPCGAGKVCGSIAPNKCKCISVVKRIKTANWTDQYEIPVKQAPLNSQLTLLGTTEGFALNEKIRFETYNFETPEIKKDIGTASVDINNKVSISGVLSTLLEAGAKVGDKYYFILSSEKGDAGTLTSEPIEIVPEEIGIRTDFVNECGELSTENAQGLTPNELNELKYRCNTALARESYLEEPSTCRDGTETVKCKWDDTNPNAPKCVNLVTRKNGASMGTCTYSVKSSGKCDEKTKMKTIDLETSYEGAEECRDCTAESKVPCGRSLLALPFFQGWQIVISILIISAIYFITARRKRHSYVFK